MPQPNVLIIWDDQHRGDCLGVLNPAIRTPNLDRLAGCSTLFERAYCSQPVCTPARGSVMTGLWPHQHGTWNNNSILPADLRCLPEYLGDGLDAGHIGKWHLGLELFPQHGFRDWVGTEDDYQRWFPPGYDRGIRSPYHHHLVRLGYTPDESDFFSRFFCTQVPEAHGKPAFAADTALDWLRRRDGKPWCLVVNTLEPHHPNTSPRNGQYRPEDVPLPRGGLDPLPMAAPERARRTAKAHATAGIDGIRYPDEASRRAAVARYYGLISLVDSHYGRILDHLHASGQFDETLIIFHSDHGEMLNQYGLWGKGVLYHAATHVPLMIKLPGQRAACRYADPVQQVDILPTILAALGRAAPAELPGRSLLPACRGEALPAADAMVVWEESIDKPTLDPAVGVAARVARARAWYAEQGQRPEADRHAHAGWRAVITPDRWRYAASTSGERELYDLASDPAEARNLAMLPEQSGRVRELHQRIAAWQRRTGDFAELPAP